MPVAASIAAPLRRRLERVGARPRGQPRPHIEFLCEPEDRGVIAEPVPAKTVQPAWLKKLPGIDRDALTATNNGLTVKRCVPFLDAMTLGWIVPLAATVRLEISDEGKTVSACWEFDRQMVSHHNAGQTAGGPWEPRPTMKFHNPWTIRTPPGWSCLFVPPLNRPNGVFEVLSGFVDTDTYVAPVNFPFVAMADDGVHTLPKGTPLIRVIPFQRDEGVEGVVRVESDDEAEERRRVYRNTLACEGLVQARVARPALIQGPCRARPSRARFLSHRAI